MNIETPNDQVTLTEYRMNADCPVMLLFCIPIKNAKGKVKGYTTLGEQNAYDKSVKILNWLGQEYSHVRLSLDAARETLALYDLYERIVALASAKCSLLGIRCDSELTPALMGLEGKRVEVTEKGGGRRRFTVGRSTGWMPCHLEIANSRSYGGGCVDNDFTTVRVV